MAYRWSLEGPAFEFPTPFGTENRFLTLRAYALVGFALLVLLIVGFVGGNDAERAVVVLETLPEPASVLPHVLCALLLAALGAFDLMQAAGQRVLLLIPGQPASLSFEVAREATGAAPGAPALQGLLDSGAVSLGELSGPYEAWLRALGADLPAAPKTLHAYLRQRLAHGVLAGGLLLLLALSVVVAIATQRPAALALVGLPPLLLCGAVLVRQMLMPAERSTQGPLALALALTGALVASAMLAWFAPGLPRADAYPRLGLPIAAAVLLVSVLLFDLLGVLAARTQIQAPWLAATPAEEVTLGFDADPEQLLRDIDLELHRQWTEGIPNRRYAWQPPQLTRSGEVGEFTATVLEESQPLVPQAGNKFAPAAEQGPGQRRPLVLLDVLGLAWTLAGGLLLVWAAYTHMRDSTTFWVTSTVGLVCLLVGGYALRVAHVLWSRVEVGSTLTWLDFKGNYFRQPAAATDSPGRTRSTTHVRVDDMRLRARVATARSVFYAAAPHHIGSRVLLELTAQRSAASAWVGLVSDFARKAAPAEGALHTAVLAARAKVRQAAVAEPEVPAPARRPPRFCSACGTPVLQGARFCQQCGNTLAAD